MMGRQTGDQSQLFYLFNLEERIPAGHLLRRINPVVRQVSSAVVRRWGWWRARSFRFLLAFGPAGPTGYLLGCDLGCFRRTPRPLPALGAFSPISSTPARSNASTTLVRLSITPRTLPSLASMR